MVSKINNTAKSRKGKMLVSTIILAAKEKKPPDKPANKQLNHTESTTATLEDKDHVEEQDHETKTNRQGPDNATATPC